MNISTYNLEFINFQVCIQPEIMLGPDEQCSCPPDTYHETMDAFSLCIPCPQYSSTQGLIGAQLVHECDHSELYYLYNI